MKTVTYDLIGGGKKTIEYDETASCILCGEPVVEASMGGTNLCPWCDMGKCRFCSMDLPMGYSREDTTKRIRGHIAWHKAHQSPP